MDSNRLPTICALTDMVITTMLMLFAFSLREGQHVLEFSYDHIGVLLLILIIALAATWRGYADAKRILSGNLQWLKPAKEGFIIGFIPLPLSQAISIYQEAFAAGPSWPSPGYSPLSDWFIYLPWIALWSAFCGAIGACYGLFLSWTNRLLIRRVRQ